MSRTFSPRFVGLVCIFLSASGFGAMPIFAKFAYADGVNLPTLLFLRFVMAGLLMALVMLLRGGRWPRGHNLWVLVAMGGLGYAGQAFCYFSALQYATAGLTALLLYLYPVIVTLLSAMLLRRSLTRQRLLAVLFALIGTGLAVGGNFGGSLLGVVLGLGAALIYSIYILVGERVTQSEDAVASGAVVMLSGAVVYGMVVLWSGEPAWPATLTGWGSVVSIALFSTVLAIVGFLAAMQRLGAADAATFSTLEPIVTVLLAAIFLGEEIGLWQALGGATILAAVVVLARSGATAR
ncbi:MAG: DMT family transporter [Betaproteobacteria bacterium]